jgi:hypothetical protein
MILVYISCTQCQFQAFCVDELSSILDFRHSSRSLVPRSFLGPMAMALFKNKFWNFSFNRNDIDREYMTFCSGVWTVRLQLSITRAQCGLLGLSYATKVIQKATAKLAPHYVSTVSHFQVVCRFFNLAPSRSWSYFSPFRSCCAHVMCCAWDSTPRMFHGRHICNVARPNLDCGHWCCTSHRKGYSLAGLLVGTLVSEGSRILNLMRDYMGLA